MTKHDRFLPFIVTCFVVFMLEVFVAPEDNSMCMEYNYFSSGLFLGFITSILVYHFSCALQDKCLEGIK